MTQIAILLTAVVVVVSAAIPASAKDLCIYRAPGDPFPFVAKNFTVPLRNTCKPLHGWGLAGMVVGTGCTRSDGEIFRVHMTKHFADVDDAESWACNFVLPDMIVGNCRNTSLDQGAILTEFWASASAHYCTGNNVP